MFSPPLLALERKGGLGSGVAPHVEREPHLHEHKVYAGTFTLLCSRCSSTPPHWGQSYFLHSKWIFTITYNFNALFVVCVTILSVFGPKIAIPPICFTPIHHFFNPTPLQPKTDYACPLCLIRVSSCPILPPPPPSSRICIQPSQPVTHLNTKLMNRGSESPDFAVPLTWPPQARDTVIIEINDQSAIKNIKNWHNISVAMSGNC